MYYLLIMLFLTFSSYAFPDHPLLEFYLSQLPNIQHFRLSGGLFARWLYLHPLTYCGRPASWPWLFAQADIWQLTSQWIDGIPLLSRASLCVVIAWFFGGFSFTESRWLSRLKLWKSLNKVRNIFIGGVFRVCVVKFKLSLLHQGLSRRTGVHIFFLL